MSVTDNLAAFNTQLETAIAAIPVAEVESNPNIYRLVKLLSWVRLASGSVGSGGGGGSSPTDVASGIDASADVDSILTALTALITELQGKADLSETQPVSAASLPLPVNAATSALQTTLNTELQKKANLTDTQPVSAASLPLPANAATSGLQTTLIQNVGAQSDTPATTNTGTFSLLGAIKRFLSHYLSAKNYYGVVVSASGDNIIIAAPAAGTEICIHTLRIQANADAASPGTLALLKRGASDTNSLRVRTVATGSGISEIYSPAEVIRCGSGNAFIVNLSAANAHGISISWHVENISTGLPV